MGQMTKIQSLLKPVAAATSQKSASETPAVPVTKSAAEANLVAALDRALAPTSKTASATPASPVEDLRKLAAEIEAADHEAMKAAASAAGRAFAQSAMGGLSSSKLASEQPASLRETYVKFAHENRDLANEAYTFGYETMKVALDKQAAADYASGEQAALADIHQAAVAEFAKAAAVTDMILDAAQAKG